MISLARLLPVFVHGDTSGRRSGLSEEVLARRVKQRRNTLCLQFSSYVCMAAVMSVYAYGDIIPKVMPLAFLLSGGVATLCFLMTSQLRFNDHFHDHYLTLSQMAANILLQTAFLWLAPQIGYLFLCVIFMTFTFATLRMTMWQSISAWTLITLGLACLFLMTDLRIGFPATSFLERVATVLLVSSTIGLFGVIGFYGSALRHQLYQGKKALREAYDRIEELAEIDDLTGAFNRRSIMRKLSHDIARSARLKRACSVALIDLDWFKRINDTYGHPAGDEVLRTFSITAFANLREVDSFGRYGGEEFMLVLPETSQSEAVRILDRLRLIFAEIDWSGLSPALTISLSAGVATWHPSETTEALLARADAALYSAKRSGRNCIASAA